MDALLIKFAVVVAGSVIIEVVKSLLGVEVRGKPFPKVIVYVCYMFLGTLISNL